MTANNLRVSQKRMKNIHPHLVSSDERLEPQEELHRIMEQNADMVGSFRQTVKQTLCVSLCAVE